MTSQIRVDEITNRSGLGTVTIYDNGFEFTGVTTFTENVDIEGNLTIGGVLTYEDTTNIDSVGVITARAGINISGGNLQVGGTNVINSGRVLYNLEQIKLADTKELVLGSGNDFKIHHSGSHSFISQEGVGALKIKGDDIRFEDAGGTEALRIDDVGRLLIGRTSVLASSAERLTIDNGMAMFRRNSTNAAAVYIRNDDTTADTRQPYLIFTDGSGNRGGFGVQYNESSLWISGQNGIAFRTGGSSPSTNERLRLNTDGKLILSGTGRTTPFIVGDGGMCIEQSYDGLLKALSLRNKHTDAAAATALSFSLNRSGGDQDFAAGEIKLIKEQAWTTSSSTVDGSMVFSTIGNGVLGERLRITSEGVITGRGELRLTEGTSTVSNGDEIGSLMFTYPSNDNRNAKIVALQNSGSSGADLAFYTRTQGDATNADGGEERLRITSGGELKIPAGIGPQITFENQHGHTGDAVISTFDDGVGTLLCLGSNFYFSSGGAETRYNTSEESAGIVINRAGTIDFNTGSTSATATSRLRIDSSGNTTLGKYTSPSTNSAISSQTLNFIGSGWNTSSGGEEVGTKLQSQHAYWTNNYSSAYGQTYPDFKILIKNSDSATYDEKFAFSGNGVMRLQSGGGINFHNYGSGTVSNILDDYEEGTWTPTCASASSVSYTNQYGRYTKVGNCITIWWDLIWTSLSGGNNARIGGLPYSPVANTNQAGYGIPVFRDASGTNSDNRLYGNSSFFASNGIRLQHYNSSANPVLGSFNGSGRITGWAQYFDNNAY